MGYPFKALGYFLFPIFGPLYLLRIVPPDSPDDPIENEKLGLHDQQQSYLA